MKCPQCETPLVMSERQGVEIDYCPQCRGVWLDRGELDKIIERSTTEMSTPRRHDDDDDDRYRSRGGEYHPHRKSCSINPLPFESSIVPDPQPALKAGLLCNWTIRAEPLISSARNSSSAAV